MKIFDSKLRKKVDFKPMQNRVKIYVCGPTVYDDAHLGHARSAISFDLLKRVLKALEYEPFLVKNFTDIDDKIIKRAKEEKKTLFEITELYTARYLEEMDRLNVQRSDLEPKATQNIEAMTSMIQTLLQKGFAYKTSKGDIYLDVQKDSKYGCISSKNDDEAQSRVEGDPEKKNPKDFALWKACKDGEDDFCFKSDGVALGRPGWHIECSAMIEKLLDSKDSEYSVDIHGGGADLLFPHHENEASQIRCAHGKEIAKYWMHNGFVNINGEKMAKSLKNSFLIKDALEVVDGEVLRFYLLSTHYRAPLNFNHEDMMSAKRRLDKLYRLKKRVYGVKETEVDDKFKNLLLEPLKDDLNISVALSVIDEFVKLSNEFLDSKEKNSKRKAHIVSNIKFIESVLGFGGSDAYEYFQRGVSSEERVKIESLIEERVEAKKAKDFSKADNIRGELDSMDIAIMDTPEGTVWEKKEKEI